MREFFQLALLGFLLSVNSHANSLCDTLCQDVSTAPNRARCYSCRCKESMDGWLPSPSELQCANGNEITILKSKTGFPMELEPVYEKVSDCNNPSLFGGACSPGGRFGQLTHDRIHVKWICRRTTYTPQFSDPNHPFDAVAVIATNMKTGATCFWNDDTGTIAANDWPSMDVTHANPPELEKFAKHFDVSQGAGCIYCHDSQPFLYSPYLKRAGWKTDAYRTSPYARVLMQGSPAQIGYKMLVSREANACISCHRIATGRTCMSWVSDAMGNTKEYGYEKSVLDALDQTVIEDGQKLKRPGPNWKLAYWMPPSVGASTDTWEQWHAKYGKAKDTVLKCCAQYKKGIKSPECTWAPIPGFTP